MSIACDECGARFSTQWNHTAHVREVHRGQRPHGCDECGARFARSTDLKRHLLTHTDERPYACTRCGAAFKQSGALRDHERLHTGERPFKCRVAGCHCVFIKSGHRDRHEQNVHVKQRGEVFLKKKEEWTAKLLVSHGIVFEREVHITHRMCGGRGRSRLDFVIYKESHVVILSVDEFQHSQHEVLCEVARMSQVVESVRSAGDGRAILWIRFNPDFFHVNGRKCYVHPDDRGRRLVDCIRDTPAPPGGAVRIVYLYYDVKHYGDRPLILSHPDYSPSWAELVLTTR